MSDQTMRSADKIVRKARFSDVRWQKIVSDSADVVSSGRVFQTRGPATVKTLLSTVESLTAGTSRLLELAVCSVRRPRWSATRTSYIEAQATTWNSLPRHLRDPVHTTSVYVDCSFAVQGPRVWNSLSIELRAPDISQTVFRNKLKTYLFNIM